MLSPDLLEQARATGRTFDEAERQALLARTEYHTAIRRLHLAGGSLREIAQALSVSHQRVQQIVTGAGGTWWRKVWGSRTIRPDATCTWCGKPPSEVDKLVAGPKVYICDGCVASAERALKKSSAAGPFTKSLKQSLTSRCAFCRKRGSGSRALIEAKSGNLCEDCLRLCREIIG
jgi:hypothetical protein